MYFLLLTKLVLLTTKLVSKKTKMYNLRNDNILEVFNNTIIINFVTTIG